MKSLLYVYPSSRATNKLGGAFPDVVVVDLEEAVPQAGKDKARDRLGETVAAFMALGIRTLVRVNGADTPHMTADLDAVARLDLGVGLLLPKPLDEHIIGPLAASLPSRPLWLMAESKDAPRWLPKVLNACSIQGLVIGGKDLCLDLGLGGYTPDAASVRDIVAKVVDVARSHDVEVFDVVVTSEADVSRAAARAMECQCAGLSFIDPAHIALLADCGEQ